jgi:hypothetical protein
MADWLLLIQLLEARFIMLAAAVRVATPEPVV